MPRLGLDPDDAAGSDTSEALSPEVRERVAALQALQTEHDDLEKKYREERAALDEKYEKLYKPLYQKRADIVNGVVGVAPAAGVDVDPSPDRAPVTVTSHGVRGIPDFWLKAMTSSAMLGEKITERDEEALRFLEDITSSKLPEGKPGFRLHFHFQKNVHFKNTVLSKSYYMDEAENDVLERAEGTKIDWYAGKSLIEKFEKKKQKVGKSTKSVLVKVADTDSFFRFFSPPVPPQEHEEFTEDEAEALQEAMEEDYELGSIFLEQLIPHAVRWYTGEAVPHDDEEEDEDAEAEEDGENEEYTDDEEEQPAPKRKQGKGAKKRMEAVPSPLPKKAQQPPDCKQQ